jgi:chemotaxis protein CheD
MSDSLASGARQKKINIVQGEHHVAKDPDVMLTTILGSCVAACLYDPVAALGGMNHFLLPGERPGADLAQGGSGGGGAMRYGAYSMELLVNGLLREGAERQRLRAKLFGGARMLKGLTDVGDSNAEFAERFLRQEGITLVGGSLRGDRGRRIQFWPTTGRAQQIEFGNNDDAIFKTESRIAPVTPKAAGSLELF